MTEVSLTRLYLLRAMYLLIAGGLAVVIWPNFIREGSNWPLMNGVVSAMLVALSLLAALGLRYPLQMLPVLLFELLWKAIWLGAVALPQWSSGAMGARTMETVWDCVLAGLILFVLPWRYLVANYVTRPGDRWSGAAR